MAKREPSGEALLSARLARAYPTLSAYSAARLAQELCSIERAQRRHAERCCSGEDGGYVRIRALGRDDDNAGRPIVREHDPEAEARAEKRIAAKVAAWCRRVAEWHGLAWSLTPHAGQCWRFCLSGPAHRTVAAEGGIEKDTQPFRNNAPGSASRPVPRRGSRVRPAPAPRRGFIVAGAGISRFDDATPTPTDSG